MSCFSNIIFLRPQTFFHSWKQIIVFKIVKHEIWKNRIEILKNERILGLEIQIEEPLYLFTFIFLLLNLYNWFYFIAFECFEPVEGLLIQEKRTLVWKGLDFEVVYEVQTHLQRK